MYLNNWMSLISDSTSVSNINIPGAHNSAAHFCRLSLFTRCQKYTVSELLSIGVRVLDIRVNGENVVHSFVNCRKSIFGNVLKISEIVETIYDFLKENPTETVFVLYKNDGKISGEKCLSVLKNVITKNKDLWYLENKMPLLSEARGKIVLLNRINSSIGVDFSRFPYQGGNKECHFESFAINENETVIMQDRYTLNPLEKWQKAIYPLIDNETDIGGDLIFNYLSAAGFPYLPVCISHYVNKKFMNCNLIKGRYYGIVMADFISPTICEKIIKTNFN